jgi:hypothetical protein
VGGGSEIGWEIRNPSRTPGDIVAKVSLLDEVRAALAQVDVPSFRLMGEDLVALGPDRLRRAADAHDAELERPVPPSLRDAVRDERTALSNEAHAFLTRFNSSIHNRIRGYVELGRRLDFEYPWPVVAILGITQVMRTLRTVHALGLAGSLLERVGYSRLAETAERTDDVLRRTNRGIFSDSAPTVLFALRCHALRSDGRHDLARALLRGPSPVWMDDESRDIAFGLYDGLAIADPDARFRHMARLTERHFGREQAILSFHMGPGSSVRKRTKSWAARQLDPRSVIAPRVRAGRLELAPFRLPDGFEMRDHDARVKVFGEAFVKSVTTSPAEYRVARDWVVARFGK